METQNYFTCTLGQSASNSIRKPFSTINELVLLQAQRIPDRKAIGFVLPGNDQKESRTDFILLDFREVLHYALQTARLLAQGAVTDVSTGQTVALISTSSIDFLVNWLGLVFLGNPVLLIAPQCTPEAVAHLCQKCAVKILLYDDQHESLAKRSYDVLFQGEDDAHSSIAFAIKPTVKSSICDLAGMVKSNVASPNDLKLPVQVSSSSISHLFHTSGTSTGSPKPIEQSHHGAVGTLPQFDNSSKASFSVTPLYHGGIADLLRAWASGALIWMFPGNSSPVTAEKLVDGLAMCERQASVGNAPPIKFFSSVPFVLELMRENTHALSYLRSMEVVGVGGASLPDESGDDLVRNGVRLASRFGSAECGFMLSSHRDYENESDWQYLRNSAGSDQLRFEHYNENLSELIVLPGWPCLTQENRADGSFSTSDLFEPHPLKRNAWKYHSRADAQITLNTGKKFDPAPAESALASSKLVQDALIFGTGKTYPGALLFRSERARTVTDDALIECISGELHKINNQSQAHSKIARDMLVPMPYLENGLDKSSKGTIMRKKVENQFSVEIEQAYRRVDSDDGRIISDEHLSSELLKLVTRVMDKTETFNEDSDLPSLGLDSIVSMRIRLAVLQLLPVQIRNTVPRTIVEDCGNIRRLSQFVISQRASDETDHSTLPVGKAEDDHMLELVESFRSFHENHQDLVSRESIQESDDNNPKEIILLTGATGTLGSHVLATYRQSARVKKIYCLVRGVDDNAAYMRVCKALEYRKLDPLSKLDSKTVVIRASLSEMDLGLSETTYEQLAKEVTIIAHLAWAVNFRLRLQSFVSDHIAGLHHLLDLALASNAQHPPNFIFCSSVASVANLDRSQAVPEEIINNVEAPGKLGYARSKWVAEQICKVAHERTRLKNRMTIVRVGQLSGDSRTGIWSQREAWPLLLSTVDMTGTLPSFEDQPLDWVPVDLAAQAFYEVTMAVADQDNVISTIGPKVFHLANPHKTVTWQSATRWIQELCPSRLVQPSEWIKDLERLEALNETHPALKLLEFWKQTYTSGRNDQLEERSGNQLNYVQKETMAISPTMRNLRPVDKIYFEKLFSWIRNNVTQGQV